MVTASLAPERTGMGSPGLAHRGYDALVPGEQLLDKLQANASAGTEDQPCGEVLIGV